MAQAFFTLNKRLTLKYDLENYAVRLTTYKIDIVAKLRLAWGDDSFSVVTFSLRASEWTFTKTGRPPDDHSTPSHHGPSSSHRRHVTVVALDHALHGGGGLGGCRERSPPDVVFPRGHLDTNTTEFKL